MHVPVCIGTWEFCKVVAQLALMLRAKTLKMENIEQKMSASATSIWVLFYTTCQVSLN